MASMAPNALMGLAGILDYLQTQQHNQRMSQYRDEALNYLDTVDTQNFGAPTLDELMTSGMFNDQPSLYFNPDQRTHDLMNMRRAHGTALDEAYGTYGTALDEGLTGLRDTTQGAIDEQNRHRIVEGSGFGLLGLDDPNQRFQEALAFGDEAAAANQDAALQSEINNSFGEMSRLGVDPYEAGAFGGTRQRLADRRFNDLFASRQAAVGERNRIQEFNVGARNTELESERATNRNIDSAIAALSGHEIDQTAGLRESMLSSLFGRQTGIDQTYLPQITELEEQIATLTQQGRVDEANRLRQNLETAQGIRMGEVGANQTLIAQRLATLLHDPEIIAMIQPLIANTFDRFQG